MSIQLIDNTLYGTYRKPGVQLVKELQTLAAPKCWQLDYIPEEGKFSIIGCGPTVNKSEIEAIFAQRTKYLSWKIEILDTFYYGNRQFALIPSSSFAQESRFQSADDRAQLPFLPAPNIPIVNEAEGSLESQINAARDAFAEALNTTVEERAAALVRRVVSGLGPYHPGEPLRVVRISTEGLNDPFLQVAIDIAITNANAGIELVWVDDSVLNQILPPSDASAFRTGNDLLNRGETLGATITQLPILPGGENLSGPSSSDLLRQLFPTTILNQLRLNGSGFQFGITSDENQSSPEPVRAPSESQAPIESGLGPQPSNVLTLEELQQLTERSTIPGISRIPRRPASPLEERALEILAPALAAASQLRSDQPVIQWTVALDESDEPLWEAMHRILSETGARINLVRMNGTITRNRERH